MILEDHVISSHLLAQLDHGPKCIYLMKNDLLSEAV
jgi:hypothetical protein